MTVEHLTSETFKAKIFDYEKSQEWEYKGENPCIIDFYAHWCGPCKMVAPIMEELAEEYCCKVDIYKVNTEEQQTLAAQYGIRSIPTLMVSRDGIILLNQAGMLPEEAFDKLIKHVKELDMDKVREEIAKEEEDE